jgi:hypothetical protein
VREYDGDASAAALAADCNLSLVYPAHGPRLYLLGSWSSTHARTGTGTAMGLEGERAPDDIPSVAAARGLMHAAARWGWHWKGLHGFPRRGRAWSVGYVARTEGRGARANPGGVHWPLVVGGRIRGECSIVHSFVPEHRAVSSTLAAATRGGRGASLCTARLQRAEFSPHAPGGSRARQWWRILAAQCRAVSRLN